MRWHEIIAESVETFDSLPAIVTWARSIGVRLDADEHAGGSRYAGDILITWIERSKKAPKGTGAQVMNALCGYADAAFATISLQADDEVGLPEYYAGFGFRIVKRDNGDDVRPTGPDMERKPRTRKPTQPLGSARAFAVSEAKPIGVALLYNGDHANYYRLFPANKIAATKADLRYELNDHQDRWVGYVVKTIEWTEMLPHAGTGRTEVIPSRFPTPNEAQERSNTRWRDLLTKGKQVFEVKP